MEALGSYQVIKTIMVLFVVVYVLELGILAWKSDDVDLRFAHFLGGLFGGVILFGLVAGLYACFVQTEQVQAIVKKTPEVAMIAIGPKTYTSKDAGFYNRLHDGTNDLVRVNYYNFYKNFVSDELRVAR